MDREKIESTAGQPSRTREGRRNRQDRQDRSPDRLNDAEQLERARGYHSRVYHNPQPIGAIIERLREASFALGIAHIGLSPLHTADYSRVTQLVKRTGRNARTPNQRPMRPVLCRRCYHTRVARLRSRKHGHACASTSMAPRAIAQNPRCVRWSHLVRAGR